MKKLVVLALAAVLAVSIMAAPAAADVAYTGAYLYEEGSSDMKTADNAALYRNLPIEAGPSNWLQRTTEFTTEVQVAQWSRWEFTGTKFTWFVRKPGEYFADSITATIQSNGNVAITFSGFGNPQYLNSNALEGVKQEIESWFGAGTSSTPFEKDFTGWIAAADLNEEEVILPDSADLHEGVSYKIWNRIRVCECNSAGIYRNTGVITLTLQNQMPFMGTDNNWATGNKETLAGFVSDAR